MRSRVCEGWLISFRKGMVSWFLKGMMRKHKKSHGKCWKYQNKSLVEMVVMTWFQYFFIDKRWRADLRMIINLLIANIAETGENNPKWLNQNCRCGAFLLTFFKKKFKNKNICQMRLVFPISPSDTCTNEIINNANTTTRTVVYYGTTTHLTLLLVLRRTCIWIPRIRNTQRVPTPILTNSPLTSLQIQIRASLLTQIHKRISSDAPCLYLSILLDPTTAIQSTPNETWIPFELKLGAL